MDSPRDCDPTATVKHDTLPLVKRPGASDVNPTVQTIRGRTPRSRLDRTAIVARSSHDQGAYVVESPPLDQMATDGDPGSRLTHNRGPIVAKIVVSLKQKLRQIDHKSGSHDTARGNRLHDSAKPPPRPLQ